MEHELSRTQHCNVGMSWLKMPDVEGDQPRTALAYGSNQNGQILAVRSSGIAGEIPR
jgi:hypothetical protein